MIHAVKSTPGRSDTRPKCHADKTFDLFLQIKHCQINWSLNQKKNLQCNFIKKVLS
jgi:hypothetical protein